MAIDLNNPRYRDRFVSIILKASHRAYLLNDWQLKFIKDMKEKWENRHDLEHITGESPSLTVKQWNELTAIERTLG